MTALTRLVALVIVLMMTLAACATDPGESSPTPTEQHPTDDPAESPAETPDATPMELISFTQGYIPGLNHIPEVLAVDYAEDFGLDLETITFTTVPDTITAMVRGDIDIMINTPSTAISGRDQDIPFVVVGGGYFRSTALVVDADLEIAEGDWDALRSAAEEMAAEGQRLRLGAAASVSTNWVECYFTLLDNDIDPEEDIEVVNIPAFGEHAGALERGDVEMLCTPEPFSTLAQQQAGTFFANPFDTPAGESLGGLVTTEEVLDDPEKREGIRRYIALFNHVVQLTNDDHELAVETAMSIMQTNDRELAESALEATKFDVGFNKDEFRELARMHHEMGHTNRDWSEEVDVWTNEEFVNELDD
jgi:ABC-type nitrate/sulfonate/bicarbonate transport system substrate-binding protein